MKKKLLAVLIIIAFIAALAPAVSRAVVTPYFTAVNDTLMPFNEDTMPYISGGEIFIPHEMLSGAGVWSVAARELGRVRLWGDEKFVDFYTGSAAVRDGKGNDLPWFPVQRIGGRFYVPMRQVCVFFGLTYEVIPVSRDIVPQEQTWIVRIRSEPGINEQSFAGVYRNALNSAYNTFHSTPPEEETPDPGTDEGAETPEPVPSEEPPPVYPDVTVYLSFNNISAGGADVILRLLDVTAGGYYQLCFFVSGDDVRENAGIIRRLASEGHTIGIRLEDGTYDEYIRTSELLFEAAKLKTPVVMADLEDGPEQGGGSGTQPIPKADPDPDPDAAARREALESRGLILWNAARGLEYDGLLSVTDAAELITEESGARQNLLAECSENSALMLSGIIAHLREFEYTVGRINETTLPA